MRQNIGTQTMQKTSPTLTKSTKRTQGDLPIFLLIFYHVKSSQTSRVHQKHIGIVFSNFHEVLTRIEDIKLTRNKNIFPHSQVKINM
jgi:hypothetical protein